MALLGRWLGVAVSAALALASVSLVEAKDELCSVPPLSYAGAKDEYPKLKEAIEALENRGIATWYSDRNVNGDVYSLMTQMVETCPEDSRLSIVVYGLPNKDCAAGYSNGNGAVESDEDYADFLNTLVEIVGKRKVLYILEPDAIGLLAEQECAVESRYEENLEVAIQTLSKNQNAHIYVDVGYWTLGKKESLEKVATIVATLSKAGRIKGITLNTSNYRVTSEIAKLCKSFQDAIKEKEGTSMNCIVDTSRNYDVPREGSEWCNNRRAGIGHPPTSDTGFDNLDYFVWIKPPGDSDGLCDQSDRSEDALVGPEAGRFFENHFIKLWNQGYMVKSLGKSTFKDPNPVPPLGKSDAHTVAKSTLVAIVVAGVLGFVHV